MIWELLYHFLGFSISFWRSIFLFLDIKQDMTGQTDRIWVGVEIQKLSAAVLFGYLAGDDDLDLYRCDSCLDEPKSLTKSSPLDQRTLPATNSGAQQDISMRHFQISTSVIEKSITNHVKLKFDNFPKLQNPQDLGTPRFVPFASPDLSLEERRSQGCTKETITKRGTCSTFSHCTPRLLKPRLLSRA